MARTRETSNRTNRVRRRIRDGREDRLHQLPEASEETQPKKVAAAQPRILLHQKTTKLPSVETTGTGAMTRAFLPSRPLISTVIFCTFLICFALPISPLCSSKFSEVFWYVFCAFSCLVEALCRKKPAASGRDTTQSCGTASTLNKARALQEI